MEHRIETKIPQDGVIAITGLPFKAGDDVEVIIKTASRKIESNDRYPLRGKPLRYDDPFGSVAEDEWDALK